MLEEVAMENWHRNSEWGEPKYTAHGTSASAGMMLGKVTQGLIKVSAVLEALLGFL